MNTPKASGRSKAAKARKQLTTDELFFYEHAGFSYDPKKETAEQGKLACARELAQAMAKAEFYGFTFNWDYDPDGCTGCDCGSDDCACSAATEHETLWAWIEDAEGNTLASLGGICGADRDYRRVVEAELASEAIGEYEQRIASEDVH